MRAASGRLCAARPAAHAHVVGDRLLFTQQVVAWHMLWRFMLPTRTIYMDGRPHPSKNAPHTWQGFSTGEWEGDMLKVTTDHLKEGWLRRNGLPRSEQATLDRIFYSPRRFLHPGYRCGGSALSDRAVYSHLELDRWTSGDRFLPKWLHPQRGSPSSERICRLSPARGEPVADGICVEVWHTAWKRLAAERRRCIPSIRRRWRQCPRHPSLRRTKRRINEEGFSAICTDALRWPLPSLAILFFGGGVPCCRAGDAKASRPGQQDWKHRQGKVEVLHVQGNVYMIAGAGANITVQVGDQVMIVVDSGVPQIERRSSRGHPEHHRQAHPFHHQYQRRRRITPAATTNAVQSRLGAA